MIIVGKRYSIIYRGSVREYSRRGEYGGTGHEWRGIARVQSVRGKFISVFELRMEVNNPHKFDSSHLFTRSRGDAHFNDFVEALPGKQKELIDHVAGLLVVSAQDGRREDDPIAYVGWSGIERKQAVQLGFVADCTGQTAMRV